MSYTKQQFKQGEILRAAQLNAMDDIIASHEERLTNMGSEDYLTTDSLKTINGESLVGSGNIVISGSGGTGTVGPQGPKGDNGADGATFTPSVDSAGNLSWTNNKGLTNPPAVNIKGPKGDKGDSGSGGSEKQYVEVDGRQAIRFSSFEPNKIYYSPYKVGEQVIIYADKVIPPTENVGEYTLYFTTGEMLGPIPLEVPAEWIWANGTAPTIESGVTYELSVCATKLGNDYIYKACLIPFKPVS